MLDVWRYFEVQETELSMIVMSRMRTYALVHTQFNSTP
jgi:hypothetical protein